MASRNLENETNNMPVRGNRNEPKKKGKKGLIIVLILLAVIGACVVLWIFNIGNLRDGVILPYLRNAPLIGNLFSDPEEGEDDGPFVAMTRDELINMILRLEENIENLESDIAARDATIQERDQTIAVLRPFERMIADYWYATARWNTMIAHGDPIAFAEWFRYIQPEFAAQLFEQVIQINQFNQQERAALATLNAMEVENAANALQDLMAINTPLMTSFLRNMSNARRAEIFDALPRSVVVLMMNMLTGQPPTFAPIAAPEINFPPPIINDIFFPEEEEEYEEELEEPEEEYIEEEPEE